MYLVRHTSVSVPKGICYGQTDVSLSASFEGELEAVKLQLENTDIQTIYSSPLSRCLKLASNFETQKSIIQDPRLKEMDFGNWEMKDWDSIHASEAGKAWFADYTNAFCPEGESFQTMVARVRFFYEELKQTHEKLDNIAVFTHAGVIRSFMVIIENITPEQSFNRSVNYGEVLEF